MPVLIKGSMKWMIYLGKIMFTTLNNKLSIICCHIPIQKQVYLHSDRNICIKLIIEFPTGSDKNIKGHVTYLENSILGWGGEGIHHTFLTIKHITWQLFSLNKTWSVLYKSWYNVNLACLSTELQKLPHFS